MTVEIRSDTSGHTLLNLICSAAKTAPVFFNWLMVWLLLCLFLIVQLLVLVVINPICRILTGVLVCFYRVWVLHRWLGLLVIVLIFLSTIWLFAGGTA